MYLTSLLVKLILMDVVYLGIYYKLNKNMN